MQFTNVTAKVVSVEWKPATDCSLKTNTKLTRMYLISLYYRVFFFFLLNFFLLNVIQDHVTSLFLNNLPVMKGEWESLIK